MNKTLLAFIALAGAILGTIQAYFIKKDLERLIELENNLKYTYPVAPMPWVTGEEDEDR